MYNTVYQHGSGDLNRASQSATYLRRVTESWDEQTITWNTQPQSTTTGQISVPAPATTTSDFEIDVTSLVRIMNDGQSNHGFLWILNPEQKYRSVFAASSDYSDPTKRPKLVVTYQPMKKYFYLKDHLGSIRVTIDENGDVKGYNDYYPFGLRMPGRSMNTALNYALYKYSSKELDEENGINWYWFNPGRYYDPEIGKFLSIDPHHYSYPDLSPYNYVGNNPLRFIDPTGMDSTEANNNNNDNTNNANVAETVTFTVLITELLKEFGVTALNIAKGGAVGVLLVLRGDEREKNESTDNSEKHEGFKKQVKKYKNKSLKKAAKSLQKLIDEHKYKLKNDPKNKAANHWKKELKNFKEQLKIIKDEISKRGI